MAAVHAVRQHACWLYIVLQMKILYLLSLPMVSSSMYQEALNIRILKPLKHTYFPVCTRTYVMYTGKQSLHRLGIVWNWNQSNGIYRHQAVNTFHKINQRRLMIPRQSMHIGVHGTKKCYSSGLHKRWMSPPSLSPNPREAFQKVDSTWWLLSR